MALAEGDAWVSSGPRSAAMLRSAPSPRDREPKFFFACGAHESNHFSPQHIKVLPLLGARPLVFLPMACGVEPTVVELRNVDTGEIDDGELEVGRTVLSLGLVTGQPLTLDFGAHAHAAARFERELREAVAGAVTNAPPVPPVAVAAKPARRQSRRAKQGLALRDTPREVQKLHHKHKRDEAQDLLAAAASGEVPKSTSVKKSVSALSSLLFSFGSLEMMRAVLDKFLSLRCVHWLLPEARGQGALRRPMRRRRWSCSRPDGEAILPCWASRAAKKSPAAAHSSYFLWWYTGLTHLMGYRPYCTVWYL